MFQEKRTDQRYGLKLKAAIVYHKHSDPETRPTFHGHTADISMSGVSIVIEHNVFSEDDVTVLLAIPPAHPGGQQKIVEVVARMIHTVHSSEHKGFRIGMQFRKFNRDGKKTLKDAIERRSIKFHH